MTDSIPSETRFAIGEVAILAYSRFGRCDGPVECAVIGPLQPRLNNRSRQYEMGYAVEVGGIAYIGLPEQMRKKRPPREDLQVTRWDECPWQPQQVRA